PFEWRIGLLGGISLVGVSKSYAGGAFALNSLNLHVGRSELLVLLGPSGGGKTTTLRLIAGLENADAGTISINDQIVNDLPPNRRNVAMMFQRPALYPNRTGFGNLLFGLELGRKRHINSHATVRELAGLLGLDSLLDRYPGELSGGQQQRL